MPEQVAKQIRAQITKKLESGGTFVLASSNLDRDFDTITPDALKSAAAQTGGELLCLWQHKRDQPVGKWADVRVEDTRLLGNLKLSSTNLGQMVNTLLDEDIPLAASIGFYGDGRFNDFGGITYTSIELLECSVVSIPANPQAQRIAKSFGVDLASLVEVDPMAASGPATSAQVAEVITKARRAVARANIVRRNHARSS